MSLDKRPQGSIPHHTQMHRQRTQHIDEKTRISTKGWSLDSLISSSRNFYPVDRVPASSSELSQFIKDHERNGLPLVVEGFHRHNSWPTKMFTLEGFEEHSKSSGNHYMRSNNALVSHSVPQILVSVMFIPGQTKSWVYRISS
jgi:hypothetical protein